MKHNPFKGTGVALVTPFNRDGSVDYAALARIVDFDIRNGADFLVALGTTSENPTLNDDERANILRTVSETASGRCPIMLGMGGNNTASLLQNIRNFDFSGISGLLSVVPFYNKPNQRGMLAHFNAVADASPVPVVLYNVPGRVGVNLQAATTLQLAEHPNIVAVKEASGNLQQIMEILRDKPAGFDVLSGDDGITQPLMSLGAAGVISVAANAYPEIFCKMVSLMRNNGSDEALRLHFKMIKMNALIFADGNPAGIKALLAYRKLCENVLRLPLVPVSDKVRCDIENEYENIKNF